MYRLLCWVSCFANSTKNAKRDVGPEVAASSSGLRVIKTEALYAVPGSLAENGVIPTRMRK
jgi:hypothetical protein